MLAKMTEGADVSDTANLSNIIVGADPLSARENITFCSRRET